MKKAKQLLICAIALPTLVFSIIILAFVINPRAVTSIFFGVNIEPVSITLLSDFEERVPDEQTRKIVTATKTFLSSLNERQLNDIRFDFDNNFQRSNWSNFPEGMIPRGGLKLGELSSKQRNLLDGVLKQILSEYGYENIQHQLETEDTLSQMPFMKYGTSQFYLAILGEPSTSLPWMFQFGGHHLAINATIYGANLSLSPMLTGGQPLHLPKLGSASIVDDEILALQNFVESLEGKQQTKASVSANIADLQHGPGMYGRNAEPKGIYGRDLNPAQKELFLNLIASRLSFMNDDDYSANAILIEKDLDRTSFGVWGSMDKFGFAYFRIVGPNVLIEYAPQLEGEDDPIIEHLHSIYRNPSNDYGIGMGITE